MTGTEGIVFQYLILIYSSDRLDAVEDLIAHPNFESEFSNLAKGTPDLERIISRIHAKSCKVKDFLKVLSVSRRDISA